MVRFLGRLVGGLMAGLACALLAFQASAQNSTWVKTGVTGRLIYVPDAEGDRIPDFSMVGYGEGKRPIPGDLPVLTRISPIAGDNTQHIQDAINFAASQPLQANGFRGVVLLGPGKFDVHGQINITTSGIVLRGAGAGDSLATNTHIVSQNRSGSVGNTPVINISGSTSGSTEGPQTSIIDKRVPVGAQSFRVASTAGLAVGGKIDVFRPSSAAWIAELGMDQMPGGETWTSRNLHWHRTITRIEGDRVYIDAPITTAIDQAWSVGTVRTYNLPDVIRNVGVENLRGQSLDAREESNESRTPTFIRFTRVDDGFARNLETRHFTYASVFTSEAKGTQHITVDNVTSRLPAGEVTGGRRYTFALDAQMSLVQNSIAEAGRHDFVTGSEVSGPIVFASSSTSGTRSDSGPHHRWGNGLLFDNLDINGNAINVQNRWTSGSGHGWAGANVVLWNSEANSFIMQAPPTAKGWLVGSSGTINSGNCHLPAGVSCQGYRDSHGTRVIVGGEDSLYQAQKNDAADIREFHWTASEGDWDDDVKWDQEIRPGVYAVSTREYLYGDYDNFVFSAAASSVDAPWIDPAWEAEIAASSTGPIVGTDVVAGDQNVAFTMRHSLERGERIVHGYLAMSLKQSGDDVDGDYLQLFDTTAANRLNFAAIGWTGINPNTPFVGVVDMGNYLDRLQTGSVNLQLSDDVAMDWAIQTLTVATPKADAGGARVFLDGGTVLVSNDGARAGSLQNGGAAASRLTIAPAGRVSVGDDYVQLPNGTLEVHVDGDGAGQFGMISAADAAFLSGTLRVSLLDGFVPNAGDAFEILDVIGGISGTFSDVILPMLPGNLVWDVQYEPTSVTLTVVATQLSGDFNQNGIVDAADFVVWRRSVGRTGTGLAADGDGDGRVDHDDYDVWRVNFGRTAAQTLAASANLPVPEPGSAALVLLAAGLLFCMRSHIAAARL